MQLLLRKSLVDAMATLEGAAQLLGDCNVNESTFRYFFMCAVKRYEPRATFQTEWHKCDLLIQIPGSDGCDSAVVEFKFYLGANRTRSLDGKLGGWKGGPSLQNEAEFQACVNKLKALSYPTLNLKFLVLVYRRGIVRDGSKHSFERSYADLTRFGVDSFDVIEHDTSEHVTCNLIRVL